MHPKILGIDAYIVMAALGFIAAFLLALFRRKRFNYSLLDLVSMLCVSIMGLTIGAKLLFILTELPAVIGHGFSAEIVKSRIINSGFVFYGGVIGALLCIWILARVMKRDRTEMLNFVIPCFTMFHCIGRIGCLLEGCCYGIESTTGVYIAGATRVPVQLYEAIALFFITACLLGVEFYCGRQGSSYRLLPLYILLYAPARFFLEMLRGDKLRGVSDIVVNYATTDGGFRWEFSLSTSQLISLLLLLAVGIWGIGLLMIKHREKAASGALSEAKAEPADAAGQGGTAPDAEESTEPSQEGNAESEPSDAAPEERESGEGSDEKQ